MSLEFNDLDLASTTARPLIVPATLLYYQYMYEFLAYASAMLVQMFLLWRIYHTSLAKQLSANLIVNIVFWIIASFAGALHAGYMMRFGYGLGPYSGLWVLWTGSFFYAALSAVSITVFFLLLDRIYSLDAPISYTRHRKSFVWATIGTALFIGGVVQFLGPGIELPVAKVTVCPTFGCILQKTHGFITVTPRVFTGILNVWLAFMCYQKIAAYRQRGGFQSSFRRTNVIAAVAIITELLLNFFPTGLWMTLSILGVEQWIYLGSYSYVFFSTDALCTALIYRIVITRRWSKTEAARSTTNPRS